MAQAIGHEHIIDVFQRFGLGQLTGAEFPGERAGRLPDHDFWSAIDRVTPAFGYGLLVTPLQLAHAYAVFANEGRMVLLTLLAQASQYNDQSASGGRQIISPVVATYSKPSPEKHVSKVIDAPRDWRITVGFESWPHIHEAQPRIFEP